MHALLHLRQPVVERVGRRHGGADEHDEAGGEHYDLDWETFELQRLHRVSETTVHLKRPFDGTLAQSSLTLFGGSWEKTGYMEFGTSSAYVEAALEALETIGDVLVSSEQGNVHQWHITFRRSSEYPATSGDVPLLLVEFSIDWVVSSVTSVAEVVKGTSALDGTFRLVIDGEDLAIPLRFNTAVDEMKAVIEASTFVGAVDASVVSSEPHAGQTWLVTFLGEGG